MTHKFKIARAAELELLPVFRKFIQTAGAQTGLDNETCFNLQLAMDEACTNIIMHGYAGLDPGSIILELSIEPEQAAMTITDFGRAFEPREMPRPDLEAPLEERMAGGLGLHFIYSVMDQVDYQSDAEGNRLYLTKKLRKPV
jgi:serine/threonine-protein kinase RsbW